MEADGGRVGREEKPRGSLAMSNLYPCFLNAPSHGPILGLDGNMGGGGPFPVPHHHVDLDAIKADFISNVKSIFVIREYYR